MCYLNINWCVIYLLVSNIKVKALKRKWSWKESVKSKAIMTCDILEWKFRITQGIFIKVRPKILFQFFHFKKFKTKFKHLRRGCFKILLKMYSEMPDFLQWLIDISGQSTSIDCTMSIHFCKLSKNGMESKGIW